MLKHFLACQYRFYGFKALTFNNKSKNFAPSKILNWQNFNNLTLLPL